MIYTSYYAAMPKLPADGYCYSISVSTPKGMNIPQLPELTPRWQYVNAYKTTKNFERFAIQYIQQLDATKLTRGTLEVLYSKYDAYLLCYERDASVCHRSILAEWLRQTLNLEVAEWMPPIPEVDLPALGY